MCLAYGKVTFYKNETINIVMSKDLNLLKEVSDLFDEETLNRIVAKDKNVDQSNIEIISWNFEELSGKGDNYLSVVNRIHIKSKINNAISESRLIVKSLPKNIFRRKLLRSTEYFHNEIVFYSEIATRFHTYLSAKEQTELLRIPCCLGYHVDGENDFIALEDVSYLGYGPLSRHSCLTYEECKNVVETIARLHAISFAFKNEKRDEFKQMVSLLNETFYREDIYETSFKYFFDDLIRIARDALAKEYPGSKGEKVFNSYEPRELFKKTVEICLRKDAETSVVSQGDTWAPNFMVRKPAPDKIDVLILDFQIARCASPTLDVVFFIYQCTDKTVRDKYYDQLLKDYYTELTKTMRILGSDPDKQYPWEIFQKEIQEQSLYGLSFALINIPITLIPPNKVFDLDSMTEELVDIADLDAVSNLEKSEDRQRLADVILHAVDKGFI